MIHGYLVGDAEVTARLDALPTKLRDEMKEGIGRCVLKLQRMVTRDKLSGQVLKVRTGTLRRSIDQVVEDDGNQVTGIVSTNVKYAAAHEYGFQGTVDVRDSLRRSKEQFSLRKLTKSGLESKASLGKWAGKGEIVVRAHSRQVSIPERSFLRSALRDLEAAGIIRDEMDAAVKRATE